MTKPNSALQAGGDETPVAKQLSDEELSAGAPAVPLQDEKHSSVHLAADGSSRALRAASQDAPLAWQPIETAPKDGRAILLGARGGAWIGKYLAVYTSGYVPENPWSTLMLNHDHMGEKWQKPTHWMPLPPPPIQCDGRDGVTDSAASSEAAKPLASNEQDGPESSAAGKLVARHRKACFAFATCEPQDHNSAAEELLSATEALDAALRAVPHQPTGERK